MPKIKIPKAARLRNITKEYPDFKTDGNVLFCTICNKLVVADKVFLVKQHLEGTKHMNLKDRRVQKENSQVFLSECTQLSKESQFHEKLCEAFVSADIPLCKIRNDKIKQLFENFTDYRVPSETILRSKYAKNIYTNCMENIRKCIKSEYLWISIDETTDATGRNVANVIVGILDCNEDKAKQKFLINTAVLDKTNHSTIARLFEDSIKRLDPNFNKDLILLFVTDAAPYMVKAAKAIEVFYPRMTHVTCIVHGLHRICERIRDSYENVNKVIANVKKVFLKSPSRVDLFKETHPELPLPPEPITTRWGTWLEAVNYYANNYEKVLEVLDMLNNEDAQSIQVAQEILRNPKTKTDLIFIASNYGFIVNLIKKLQISGLTLLEQMKILTDAMKKINNAPHCDIKYIVQNKVKSITDKNKGLEVIQNICKELCGSPSNSALKYEVNEVLAFKFAPITSVDVERSFSMYKNILRCNRQNFLFENLSEYFIVYCNNNLT